MTGALDAHESTCTAAVCDVWTDPNMRTAGSLAKRSDDNEDDPPDPTANVVTVTETTVTTSTVTDVATMTELSTVTSTGTISPPESELKMLEDYNLDEAEILWAGGPKPDAFVYIPKEPWEEFAAVCNLIIQHENSYFPFSLTSNLTKSVS